MNSTEEESTFFVTIEKSNIKNLNQNFRNTKSNHFCQPIKTIRSNKNNIYRSSSYIKNNKKINLKSNINSSLPTQNKIINNDSKINNANEYIPNLSQSQNFISSKKNNNNQKETANFEENIDIEDIDEFNDTNLNVNINKPRLPFSIKVYYNNSASSSISRNILSNYLEKNSKNSNSKLIKTNKLYQNKSCSSDNKDLLKLKLSENISLIESEINNLKNLIQKKNLEILSLKIFFEKQNSSHRIRKNNRNYEKNIDEMRKEIFNLKIKKSKCEDKYINKKLLEKKINNENIIFLTKKAEIIEKIMDYKLNIHKKNINFNTNNNMNYIEITTIINDSYIFDNEYSMAEAKENMQLSERKNELLKKDEKYNEELIKKDNYEVNCIKNKDPADYFVPKFLVETKNYNKNKGQQKYKLNSKFNIFINK